MTTAALAARLGVNPATILKHLYRSCPQYETAKGRTIRLKADEIAAITISVQGPSDTLTAVDIANRSGYARETINRYATKLFGPADGKRKRYFTAEQAEAIMKSVRPEKYAPPSYNIKTPLCEKCMYGAITKTGKYRCKGRDVFKGHYPRQTYRETGRCEFYDESMEETK